MQTMPASGARKTSHAKAGGWSSGVLVPQQDAPVVADGEETDEDSGDPRRADAPCPVEPRWLLMPPGSRHPTPSYPRRSMAHIVSFVPSGGAAGYFLSSAGLSPAQTWASARPSRAHGHHRHLSTTCSTWRVSVCMAAPAPQRSFKRGQREESRLPLGARQGRKSAAKRWPCLPEPLPGKNGPPGARGLAPRRSTLATA
jgi:hypothetical protein